MKTRYLTLLLSLAFLGFTPTVAAHPCERDNDPNHRHCSNQPPPGPDPVVEYTAAMVLGAFRFGAVDVTLNKKGNFWSSTVKLDMVRPLSGDSVPSGQYDWTSAEQSQWDKVFAVCPELFSGATVASVSASDNWSIDNGGPKNAGTVGSNISIQFRDVAVPGFPAVLLDFSLSGVLDYPLPPISVPVFVELDYFHFFGGGDSSDSCRSDGTQSLEDAPSVLVITRK